jgi:tetratricopeptide (TPR) repeat protein
MELKPDLVMAHYNLGNVLRDQRRPAAAEAAFRRAIELRPDYAQAHVNLGGSLKDQGRFAEALAAVRRGHDLGSRQPDWRYPSARWVRQGERLAALDARLPAVLRGAVKPTGAELAELADLCQRYKKQFAAAARLYSAAFAAKPILADDLAGQHRYNAACAAAQAGSGQGGDAPPDGADRARLRGQALDWLRADLIALTWTLADGPVGVGRTVADRLGHWERDADLAAVRGDALGKLPETERAAWRKLWADVGDVLTRAESER